MNHLSLSGLLAIFLIIGLTDHITSAVKISGTNCTGDNDCAVQHSECDTTGGKCKCSDTFVENTPGGDSCVSSNVQPSTTKVSETPCTGDGDCSVDHSECGTGGNCKCSDAFVESKPDGTACESAPAQSTKVSETPCTGDGDCSVDHSECGTGGNCKCSDTFIESKPDGTSCESAPAQSTKVSDTSCSGPNDCKVEHSECGTGGKCKCSDNFVESKPAGTSCDAVSAQAKQVSTVTCSSTGTECSSIPSAICANKKCACKDGYKEDSNGGKTCKKVLGAQCTGSNACPGASNSLCKSSICKCSTDFAERDNSCKPLLSSKDCKANVKACEGTVNAECDSGTGKCKCKAGFTLNVDVCAADNAGVAMTMKLRIMALPIVLAVLETFKRVM